jgi:hypothetical protein
MLFASTKDTRNKGNGNKYRPKRPIAEIPYYLAGPFFVINYCQGATAAGGWKNKIQLTF